jgi:CRP-like cAMP-binding protein
VAFLFLSNPQGSRNLEGLLIFFYFWCMDKLLEYFGQFIDLSEEAKKLLAGTTDIITVPKGAIMIHQGQVNHYSYLVLLRKLTKF